MQLEFIVSLHHRSTRRRASTAWCFFFLFFGGMIRNMKVNLTPKQEKFALAYVETGNASAAYRKAYNVGAATKASTVNRKAKECIDNGKISARVAELQKRAQQKHDITIETLTDMYREAFEMGKDIEQPAAMNGSATGLAKLHGLITDRTQAEVSVSFGFADRMAARRAKQQGQGK